VQHDLPVDQDSPPSDSSSDRTDSDSDQERLPPRKEYISPPPRSSLPPTTSRPLRNDRPPYPPPLARAPQNPLPIREPPMSSAAQEQANLDWMKAHPPGPQIRPVQQGLRPSLVPPSSEFRPRANPSRNEPSRPLQDESRRHPSRDAPSIDSPPPSTSAPSDFVNSEEPVRSQSRWSRPPRNQYEREEVDGGLSPLSRPRRQDFPSPQQESNEINETSGSELDTDGSLPPINRSHCPPSVRPRPPVPVPQRRDATALPTNQGEFSEDSDPIPASQTPYPRRARVIESSSIPRDPPRSGSVVEQSSPSEEEERPVRSPRQRPTIRGQLREDLASPSRTYRARPFIRPVYSAPTSEEESDHHEPLPTPRQRAQLLPSESASPRNDPLVSTRQNGPAEESQARPPPSVDPRLSQRAEALSEISEPESDSSIRSPPPEEIDSMRPPPAPFRRRQSRNPRAVPSEPPYLEQSSTLPSRPPDTHTDSEQSDVQPEVVPEPMNRSARRPSPELSEDGSVRRRRALPQARRGEAEGEIKEGEREGRDVEGRGREEELRGGGYQTDSSRDSLQGESDREGSHPFSQQPRKNLRRSSEPTDPIREKEEEDLQERRPIRSRRQPTFDETAQLPQTSFQSSLRTSTADSNYREDRENESNENPETAPRPLPSRPFVINQRSPLPASIPDSSPGPYEPTEFYERAQRNSAATPFEATSFDRSTPPSPEPSLLPSQGRSKYESRDEQSDFNDSDSDSAAVEPQISPTRISRPEDRCFVQRERLEPPTSEEEQEPLPTRRRTEPAYEEAASESSRGYQDMDKVQNGERSGEPMRDDFDGIYRDKGTPRSRSKHSPGRC